MTIQTGCELRAAGELPVAVEHLKQRRVPEAAMDRALDRAARYGLSRRSTDHRLRRQAILGFRRRRGCVDCDWPLVCRIPRMRGPTSSRPLQAKPWIHGAPRRKPGHCASSGSRLPEHSAALGSGERFRFSTIGCRLPIGTGPKKRSCIVWPPQPSSWTKVNSSCRSFRGRFAAIPS